MFNIDLREKFSIFVKQNQLVLSASIALPYVSKMLTYGEAILTKSFS